MRTTKGSYTTVFDEAPVFTSAAFLGAGSSSEQLDHLSSCTIVAFGRLDLPDFIFEVDSADDGAVDFSLRASCLGGSSVSYTCLATGYFSAAGSTVTRLV